MKKLEHLKSFWHYPRSSLTARLVQSFCIGLVNSFTIFAQRRMGKTEFLLHDLKPALEQNGYKVIYFSFYDFAIDKVQSVINSIKSEIKPDFYTSIKIKELSLPWCKFTFNDGAIDAHAMNLSELLSALAYQTINSGQSGVVLLLDEIQELQAIAEGDRFISGLRTALDVNKEEIKVIFTGSSQNGLKRMFSDKNAPFFHFGSNIELQKLDKQFTDFLADRFYERILIQIDKDKLYEIFLNLDSITAHIRRIISLLLLEPDMTLKKAYKLYLQEIYNPEILENEWISFSHAEQCVYLWVLTGNYSFYSEKFKKFFTSKYPNEEISNSKIQYALAKLLDKSEIRALNTGDYECCNFMLNKWLREFNGFE